MTRHAHGPARLRLTNRDALTLAQHGLNKEQNWIIPVIQTLREGSGVTRGITRLTLRHRRGV